MIGSIFSGRDATCSRMMTFYYQYGHMSDVDTGLHSCSLSYRFESWCYYGPIRNHVLSVQVLACGAMVLSAFTKFSDGQKTISTKVHRISPATRVDVGKNDNFPIAGRIAAHGNNFTGPMSQAPFFAFVFEQKAIFDGCINSVLDSSHLKSVTWNSQGLGKRQCVCQ